MGQTQPNKLTLDYTIFDQHPTKNRNFEPESGSLTKNIVRYNLDPSKRVPDLNSMNAGDQTNKNGRIVVPDQFSQWFANAKDVNIPMNKKLELTLNNKGVYSYWNEMFFPIENEGWDQPGVYNLQKYYDTYNNRNQYHNYHFCLKINSKFTYQGIETFEFIGDDDVWVFIDNKLVVDLGGLHSQQEAKIDLQTLDFLQIRNTYNFDFFYCERHTNASRMKIQTNIEVFCPVYDYCGVCQGDGTTCCLASRDCNDGNPCTIDSCPVPGDGINSGNWKDHCKHQQKSCPNPDKCNSGFCDGSGSCQSKPIECPKKTEQCLALKGCNPSTGCSYTSTCVSDKCTNRRCDNGNCIETKIPCSGSACYNYTCDPLNGCSRDYVCVPAVPERCHEYTCTNDQCVDTKLPQTVCDACNCQNTDKCKVSKCDQTTLKCTFEDRPEINDGNPCTKDDCDPSSGEITHTPIDCKGCATCTANPDGTGSCKDTDKECDDGNICTIDRCTSTNCTHTLDPCDDNDPCTIDTCDETDTANPCKHTPVVCEDEGKCKVGQCNKQTGQCELKPRTCGQYADVFCIESQCDEASGCLYFEKRCVADNPRCQKGICSNETASCESKDYDPKPFICKTAAVVSTAVIAGVTVAGAVALGIAIFGGKKGYDYWKESRNNKISVSNSNPLYEQNANAGGENPLYT
eukprot:gene1200-1513_t